MGDAYRCDFCPKGEQFHDGDPAEQLFIKRHYNRQGTDVIQVADLCQEHATEVLPERYQEGDDS
jgi:hypothetical protein